MHLKTNVLGTLAGWAIVIALIQLLIWTAATYSIPKEMEYRSKMSQQAKAYAAALSPSVPTSWRE